MIYFLCTSHASVLLDSCQNLSFTYCFVNFSARATLNKNLSEAARASQTPTRMDNSEDQNSTYQHLQVVIDSGGLVRSHTGRHRAESVQ